MNYHAVLVDETGCEFGADCQASSHDEAYDIISANYPESSIVQLESPADTEARQMELYARICAEYDDGEDRWDY